MGIKARLVLYNCRPFSINNAFYKRTFNMTAICRKWRKTIIEALKKPANQEQLDYFRKNFNPARHGISIAISHTIPKSNFFTTKGEVSRRSMDLTNIEKLLVDIIFDSRFSERNEINNLAIDDKFIVKLYSEKIVGKMWKVVVELKLIDLDPARKRVKNFRG